MTGPRAQPAIEIRNVEKTFGAVRAVDGVSLTVPQGGVMAIVGESGCGKSTLARMILGLMVPNAGEIRVDGAPLHGLDRKSRARLIQPIFQDPYSSLNPRQRVREIVSLPIRIQNHPNPASAVADILFRVGLSGMAERYPSELSGGQRQRVAIARALILGPRIIICDEPTSALDVSVQAQILDLLGELRAERDLTIVFISHNLAVVEHIATEVAVMYLGRIVEHAALTGGPDDLFAAPRHPYTRALLSSVLTPDPGLGIPDPGLGDAIPDPAHIPSGCRLHPRCPVAIPRCAGESPAGIIAGGHLVECLLAKP